MTADPRASTESPGAPSSGKRPGPLGGPRRLGLRPGREFIHRLPVARGRDSSLRIMGLPGGLRFDPGTQVIAGRTRALGTHRVTVSGDVPAGTWTDEMELVVGDEICLTPPLGWNSWNCFGTAVNEDDVRNAAEILITSGLADLGWVQVNIDDGWQGGRDRRGRLQPNQKFGDLATLCADLHALGLRVGIYASPGQRTCAGFEGSAGHEREDAQTFAAWGFDYLKYDWCTVRPIDEETPRDVLVAPMARMRDALDCVDRDIVYHLSQYGIGSVWEWGRATGANAWRTTGDIEDSWESVDRIGFGQADLARYAGPGGWNDPDMLVLGRVGGGWYQPMRQTRLTPDEQRTHLGLWMMLGAPLLLGCDLTALDVETFDLVANAEALDVHQDPLGRQARRVTADGAIETWRKELADGSSAIGIFNRSGSPATAAIEWSELGLTSPATVRDLWSHRDLEASTGWQDVLPAHGSVLLRASPPSR